MHLLNLQQHVITIPDNVVVPGILKSLLLMQGIEELITLCIQKQPTSAKYILVLEISAPLFTHVSQNRSKILRRRHVNKPFQKLKVIAF